MKLSIAWIFEHLQADWRSFTISELVQKFNNSVAEIEDYYQLSLKLDTLSLAQIVNIQDKAIILKSFEWKSEIIVEMRPNVTVGQWYFVKKNGDHFCWASTCDFGAEKDALLSAVVCSEQEQNGAWKKNIVPDDYILVIDNKSITNRPDLWGHRGIARELGSLYNISLKPLDLLLAPITQHETGASAFNATKEVPFSVAIKDTVVCKRLAILFIPQIKNESSLPWMSARLARIDSKPINAIVDTTNYVMFDLGQPMHAFDAQTLEGNVLQARYAKVDEKIQLLDGEEITLTKHDCVIADGKKPVALAGIMGGLKSSVTQTTTSVLLEAACFDATTIRRTSARVKKRTEASARFEKTLDPLQNIFALQRFIKLYKENDKALQYANDIISLGEVPQEHIIKISPTFIEQRLGVVLSYEVVKQKLQALGFKVEEKEGVYTITVPSYRASKDIAIPEDIVEEVARLYGYDKIPFVLPSKRMEPSDVTPVMRLRNLKQLMAYNAAMYEVNNYPFFDEEFLQEIHWEPERYLEVMSPVSQHWRRLVTSLIPHLLKNVQQNLHKEEQLRFFEWNRIWPSNSTERRSCAGIFFRRHGEVDFYQAKNSLVNLFAMLKIDITWVKASQMLDPWYNLLQTATLMHKEQCIGTAGMIADTWVSKISSEGQAFAFELDGDFLLSYKESPIKFKPLYKYPETALDISMLVPLSLTVDQLITTIREVDAKIKRVGLIDAFQKTEWHNKKSLTFRFHVVDEHKTLTKDEIDSVLKRVTEAVTAQGATVR